MRRHELDLTSLLAGLVFASIAVAYLLADSVNLTIEWRWVAPLVLIGLGVAGIAGSLRGTRRDQ